MKVRKSDYIHYSRFLVRKLHRSGCYGEGSMYEDTLLNGSPDKNISRVVLVALVKQKIVMKKKKKYGWKYFLNSQRREKVMEIAKEMGRSSIIPLLLFL